MTNTPPSLRSRNDVAELLGVEQRKLTWWIWALDTHKRYTEFDIQRRDGRLRRISAPIKPIKDLQRQLAGHLAAAYSAPPQVHGFVSPRNTVSNAARHQQQQWVLRVDIEDFFPSINFGRVRGLFMSFPFYYPTDVATVLAQICCHNNELPQGAPTSPVISNLICRGMDKDLAALARSERCHYTRYADDLIFSTDRRTFPASLATNEAGISVVGPALEQAIISQGFAVNHSKTRLSHRTQRQRVTGLVVNKKVNVPRTYIRSLRNLLYIWDRYSEDDAIEAFGRHEPMNWPPGKPASEFRLVVRGRIQYVGGVKGWDSTVYRRLAERLMQLDPDFRPTVGKSDGDLHATIFTEGQTDPAHLRAALRHFKNLGDYQNLSLEFGNHELGDGDGALLSHLKELTRHPLEHPAICLFDRDAPKVIRQARLDKDSWWDHGKGVASVGLVCPDFRSDPFCIEMLYNDTDLRRQDASGRRIYLFEEFDKKTGNHRGESCHLNRLDRTNLVRDDVYDSNGKSLGLSKASFAKLVEEADPPFDEMSFEGFRPTFDLLVESIKVLAQSKLEITAA